MNIRLFDGQSHQQGVLDVLSQLRPQYNHDALLAQIIKQQGSGYQVAYAEDQGHVTGVVGFRVGENLAWGKHIYIDDLVTDVCYQSKGVGQLLLDWLKNYARENDCQQIHLDSGVQRFAAHRFYLRERFQISSHHFALNEL